MLLGTVGMAVPKRRKLLSYSIVFLLVSGCLLQVACNGASNSGSGRAVEEAAARVALQLAPTPSRLLARRAQPSTRPR
jgi:hypothetical protein